MSFDGGRDAGDVRDEARRDGVKANENDEERKSCIGKKFVQNPE